MKTVLTGLLEVLLVAVATAGQFTVDSSAANRVTFYAQSTFGSFTGVTSRIGGSLIWIPEDSSAASFAHFTVDLASLDTGVGKRNKHMRQKYLETDSFPTAVYDGRITSYTSKSDSLVLAQTAGTLTIHGVARPLTTEAKVYRTVEGWRVFAAFPLNIRDFNIRKPKFLLVSMKEEIRLQVDFFLKPAGYK